MFALETNEDYCNKGFKYAIAFFVGEWLWVIVFAFFTMLSLRLGQHIKFRTSNGGLEVTDVGEQKMSKLKKQELIRAKIRKQQEAEERKKAIREKHQLQEINHSIQQRH
mmetsp:Transcript_12897/g.9336  ORF Transcript_12897/g.9336 Transcript_12897/m.9336 type:complete len:109 (+) Transcript_12897:179-505(+)